MVRRADLLPELIPADPPPGDGASPHSFPQCHHHWRAGWRRLVGLIRRIDDSWVGDMIGIFALFFFLFAALIAAALFE